MINYIKEIFKSPISDCILWKIRKLKLKRLNISLGYMSQLNGCKLEENISISKNCELSNVIMGQYTYVSEKCRMFNSTVGKFCSIGPNVTLGGGNHPTNTFVSTHPAFYSIRKQCGKTFVEKEYFNEIQQINIGNDVWIGGNVFIKDGVNIGNGAIIAAGSIVIKDVKPYAIVGGVPAKLIKFRFKQADIDFLESLEWWNKDEEWFKNNSKLMRNIDDLKDNY
ncbi:CatB-related O-acetyltransferase [Clostridium sp. CTA-5]